MNPARAVLAAALTVLKADATLTAIIPAARMVAGAIDALAFPHLILSEVSSTARDTSTSRGRTILIDVHVWGEATSAAGGRAAVYAALDAIDAALHHTRPALTGHVLIDLIFEGSRLIAEPDGVTLHGVASFRALTEES